MDATDSGRGNRGATTTPAAPELAVCSLRMDPRSIEVMRHVVEISKLKVHLGVGIMLERFEQEPAAVAKLRRAHGGT